MRKRAGKRIHRATFKRFDGTVDSVGQEMRHVPENWDDVSVSWPCEFVTTVGGEILRGRMVTEKSTHVLFGQFSAVESVDVQDTCVINSQEYGINYIGDPDGLRMEMRVELRKIL